MIFTIMEVIGTILAYGLFMFFSGFFFLTGVKYGIIKLNIEITREKEGE